MAGTSNVSNFNLDSKETLSFSGVLDMLGSEYLGLHSICNYTYSAM